MLASSTMATLPSLVLVVCCDMTSSIQEGLTPLMVASMYGHVECVKGLLERGAEANLQHKVSLLQTCFLGR